MRGWMWLGSCGCECVQACACGSLLVGVSACRPVPVVPLLATLLGKHLIGLLPTAGLTSWTMSHMDHESYGP
eukprot:13127-Pelagomonas_calceolata.AAC.1